MKANHILLPVLILSGCNDDSSSNASVDKNDELIDNTDISSYIFSSNRLTKTSDIERQYSDAFDLDNITANYLEDSNSIQVINHTPRYLNNPTLSINDEFYSLDILVEPFQEYTFSLSGSELEIDSIQYIEQQPFFKYYVNSYSNGTNENYSMPTEAQAQRYEQEMRGLKNAINDLGFNVRFAEFITNYGTTRSLVEYAHDEVNCTLHDHTRSGDDNSPLNTKFLSMLTHKPTSKHRMLTSNASSTGLATVGDGWVALQDYALYEEGDQYPGSAYFHEKMHNHGFGHYAGMTYGLPELLTEYTKEGFLENFYNDQALINSMTSATVALDVIDVDIDYLDLHFSFYTNDSESLNEDEYIDQFLLVLPDSINISHIQVKQSGIVKDLTANSTFADGQALYFDQDISIKILPFSEQKSEDKDQLIIRIERPDYAGDMAFLASGQQAPWSRQANKLVQITPEYGLKADSNRLVYFSPTGIYSHDTDLQLELGYHTFTPTEAAEYCSDKGLTLGMLETYQSEAQMDFQSLYLKYGSQVGIDPDTLEPVAVNVPTTYRPEVVEYIDAGKLVVCSYE